MRRTCKGAGRLEGRDGGKRGKENGWRSGFTEILAKAARPWCDRSSGADMEPCHRRRRTGAGGIRVRSTEGQVILTGTAVDAVAAERAMAIATGSAPKGAIVVNAMNVAGPQQVMLEVRFLEVARSAGRNLGVNLSAANANGTNVGISGLGGVT